MRTAWILLIAGVFVSCKEVNEPDKSQASAQASITASTEIGITDLGTLGGGWSRAIDLNERGQVVGESETSSGEVHAFLWDKGTMSDIGAFLPAAINNGGQIVGKRGNQAVFWERGVITELGTLGGASSTPLLACPSGSPGFCFLPTPRTLNESGAVTGTSTTATGESHAFFWRNGEMTDLGTLGGTLSGAAAIEDGGQVLGGSTTADGEGHTVVWHNGKVKDLGTGFAPADFNHAGLIAGTSDDGAVVWRHGELQVLGDERIRHALLVNERGDVAAKEEDGDVLWIWNKGVLTRVSTVRYANPIALNNQGQFIAVGSYGGFSVSSFSSIVWQDGVTKILPALWCDPPRSPDYYLCNTATAINNRGDIVGASMINQGEGFTYHAVLWTTK
ncbi:MAG TPA: hypothetical protein VN803_05465 [Gemmatimonadales bacterium]|nr:hypothetical protein [Gemmatimonadales bacterium]